MLKKKKIKWLVDVKDELDSGSLLHNNEKGQPNGL